MSVATTVSRLTGFVRTWAMAYALGATFLASSYTVANNIPNMVFELIAGGILSSVFIPVYIERRQRHGDEDAWRFASSVFNLTMLVLGVVAIAGTIWAGPFVRTQTFRISAEDARLATYLFSFFAVQIVFYGAMAVFTGILNSHRRFVAPAVAPIFNNVVVIVTMFVYSALVRTGRDELALPVLAIGTTLGVVTMAAVQVPSLFKVGLRYSPALDLRHPGVRKMALLIGPTVGYVITNLVAVSFRNAYALEATRQGPAFLLYAWMFYQLPYGIFAVALATAIFPELSTRADEREWDAFKATFAKGLRVTAALIIPMAAMLVALSTPLIELYRVGRFSASDVPHVAAVLSWWGFGLLFFASYMFVLKTFYSMQDTRTPMLTNVFLTVLHVGLYAVLTTGFGSWAGIGLVGIPIGDAVFYAVHVVVLALILRHRIGGYDVRGIAWSAGRVVLAAAVGAGAALGVTALLPTAGGYAGLVARLFLAGGAGLAVTYGLAAAMRVPEIAAGWGLLRRARARFLPRRTGDA